MVYSQRIINIDRGQHIFQLSFVQFADRLISKYRLQHGAALIRKYGHIFNRAEREFGVPAAVITGFLGAGKRFRLQYGQLSGDHVADDASL